MKQWAARHECLCTPDGTVDPTILNTMWHMLERQVLATSGFENQPLPESARWHRRIGEPRENIVQGMDPFWTRPYALSLTLNTEHTQEA